MPNRLLFYNINTALTMK